MEEIKLKVRKDFEYLNDWKDGNGNCAIDNYLKYSKIILNKSVTGCGFTTYALSNRENTILVSPRLALIHNKDDQFIDTITQAHLCFYFNRERDKKEMPLFTVEQLSIMFDNYRKWCQYYKRPMKILVTYDSFTAVADMLEQTFHYKISDVFRIVIDEAHCIVKDVKLKEYNNKCILSNFVGRLFRYQSLLFVSATPITDYLLQISEFKNSNDLTYIELDWENKSEVHQMACGCKSPTDAFDRIYKQYAKQVDPNGRHYFDAVYYADGSAVYSYEAVIFLNSVIDIQRIISKYVNRKGVINVQDITVICSDNKVNQALLKRTNKQIRISAVSPKGVPHTPITFVTRTAFEGVDFYSTCASTYVIANYKVESLSLDIVSDIPQIVGRQRLKSNVFRDKLTIFYTDNNRVVDDACFNQYVSQKLQDSHNQISIWQSARLDLKGMALQNIATQVEYNPNLLYIKTTNGIPEINDKIIVCEQYCHDILSKHLSWFVISPHQNQYGLEIEPLLSTLNSVIPNGNVKLEYIRLVHQFLSTYPQYVNEVLSMLHYEGYSDIAYYFCKMTMDRIAALAYDPWKIEQEITFQNALLEIQNSVRASFKKGCIYSKKEAKSLLQAIYDTLGLNKTAKSTELALYLPVAAAKKDGRVGVRIL